MTTVAHVVRAPRGTARSCHGWPQEAALRMLMNNLDPDVAERPDDLVVYDGSGKAARNWPAFEAIVSSLRSLETDETLVVQSGKPVAIFRTHEWAPTQGILQGTYETLAAVGRRHFGGSLRGRLAVTAGLGGMGGAQEYCRRGVARSIGLEANAADVLPELAARGVIPDVVTDQTSAHDALQGYVPNGLPLADALRLRERAPEEYIERSMAAMAAHVRAMLDGSDAIADWPVLNALLNTSSGATWVSVHHGGGVGIGCSLHAGMVVVADGSAEADRKLERVLTCDPGIGVARHADAGYPDAIEAVRRHGIHAPMLAPSPERPQ